MASTPSTMTGLASKSLSFLNYRRHCRQTAVYRLTLNLPPKMTKGELRQRKSKPKLKRLNTLTGISINPDKDETPIQLAQRFLSQLLGLKLECIGKRGGRGKQQNTYRGCSPNPDGRQEIFERWLERERLSVEKEAQAVTAPAPSKNVTDDTVSTLSIYTYIPTETVDTKQVDTETPPQKVDPSEISQPPNQQTEPPSSRTLQTGESVLIYHPFYEDRFKGRIKGIIQKVAQHATGCWEVLVDGVVRKVWYREWLFPATEGKGFDST